MAQFTTETSTYDFDNAVSKINDAIGRVMRHKDNYHEGQNANDLQIIIVQLQAALHSLVGDKSGAI